MSSSRTGEPAIDREPMNLSPHLDREEVARVLDLDGYLRDELRRSAARDGADTGAADEPHASAGRQRLLSWAEVGRSIATLPAAAGRIVPTQEWAQECILDAKAPSLFQLLLPQRVTVVATSTCEPRGVGPELDLSLKERRGHCSGCLSARVGYESTLAPTARHDCGRTCPMLV